ncbi:hypothetical protein DIPPA_05273 [Diplonema papillatum]|nr:hypothetical protein DIPPA_05273 [Diplonema papillatum]
MPLVSQRAPKAPTVVDTATEQTTQGMRTAAKKQTAEPPSTGIWPLVSQLNGELPPAGNAATEAKKHTEPPLARQRSQKRLPVKGNATEEKSLASSLVSKRRSSRRNGAGMEKNCANSKSSKQAKHSPHAPTAEGSAEEAPSSTDYTGTANNLEQKCLASSNSSKHAEPMPLASQRAQTAPQDGKLPPVGNDVAEAKNLEQQGCVKPKKLPSVSKRSEKTTSPKQTEKLPPGNPRAQQGLLKLAPDGDSSLRSKRTTCRNGTSKTKQNSAQQHCAKATSSKHAKLSPANQRAQKGLLKLAPKGASPVASKRTLGGNDATKTKKDSEQQHCTKANSSKQNKRLPPGNPRAQEGLLKLAPKGDSPLASKRSKGRKNTTKPKQNSEQQHCAKATSSKHAKLPPANQQAQKGLFKFAPKGDSPVESKRTTGGNDATKTKKDSEQQHCAKTTSPKQTERLALCHQEGGAGLTLKGASPLVSNNRVLGGAGGIDARQAAAAAAAAEAEAGSGKGRRPVPPPADATPAATAGGPGVVETSAGKLIAMHPVTM